jgi:hypothetical protein
LLPHPRTGRCVWKQFLRFRRRGQESMDMELSRSGERFKGIEEAVSQVHRRSRAQGNMSRPHETPRLTVLHQASQVNYGPSQETYGSHLRIRQRTPPRSRVAESRLSRVRQVYTCTLMIIPSEINDREKDDGKQRRLLNTLQDTDIHVRPKRDRSQPRHI